MSPCANATEAVGGLVTTCCAVAKVVVVVVDRAHFCFFFVWTSCFGSGTPLRGWFGVGICDDASLFL